MSNLGQVFQTKMSGFGPTKTPLLAQAVWKVPSFRSQWGQRPPHHRYPVRSVLVSPLW